MEWFTNFVRPRLKSVTHKQGQNAGIDGVWIQCRKCEASLFNKRLERDLYTCHKCGNHLPMPVNNRLELIYGHAGYDVVNLKNLIDDPLRFRDTKRYVDRLKATRQKLGKSVHDAITVAKGEILGADVVTAVFNFAFIGGSMGMAVGEGFLEACRIAIRQRAMLLVVVSSGGARMQEGIMSLMQMPRTVIGVSSLKEAGLPYVVLLTHPTTGGVLASLATLGDIHIAEPQAVIGFAGRRVIEQTLKEKLPQDFQSAEYCLEHGLIDDIVARHELREKLEILVDLLVRRRTMITPSQIPEILPKTTNKQPLPPEQRDQQLPDDHSTLT